MSCRGFYLVWLKFSILRINLSLLVLPSKLRHCSLQKTLTKIQGLWRRYGGQTRLPFLNQTPELYLSGVWWVCSQVWIYKRTLKRNVYSKENRSTCLKIVNHARLNSQHNWGTCMINQWTQQFSLIMKKIFISAPKITKQMAMDMIHNWLSSWTISLLNAQAFTFHFRAFLASLLNSFLM